MLKVSINTVTAEQCDKNFLYIPDRKNKLSQGIVDDSMLCAGNPEGGNDTCGVSIPYFYAHFSILNILTIL